MMAEHFNLTEDQYKEIADIPLRDQIEATKEFAIGNNNKPLTLVSLLTYIDRHGGAFIQAPQGPHKRIALAIYSSYSAQQRLKVLEYIDGHENEWEDEED